MTAIIVSRHPAAIEFIRRDSRFADADVIVSATTEDVIGKIVVGNLPMNLAAHAAEVHVVEFDGAGPRGVEYTAAEMEAAGARIRAYKVVRVEFDGAGRNPTGENNEIR